ncbi:MAG: hypothetical protein H7222_16230 [Methylotenera sp.]|nr:hypothetical protein [Oligoflexia bacterium]
MIKTQKKNSVLLSALTCAALALALAISLRANADEGSVVPRPPQFVLLAFDGSKSIEAWDETRAFAKEATASGKPVKFTYFVSGVYFIHPDNKNLYHAPHHTLGYSDIGYGKSENEISDRVDELNDAFNEGNEMASHANGHFDGSTWSESDWASEFTQFIDLLFNTFKHNDITKHFSFAEKDIVGFRAPLLAFSPGLYPTLAANHYRYDTSKIADTHYWPEKNSNGIWNFPLASLPIVGSGKWTLSMDYNFYMAQSDAKEKAENGALYEKQMLDTYMKYFKDNYYGNRGPVHIGHHFTHFNGGAYWSAMKKFASSVCGLPEVKCVTYSELANFMDAMLPETRNAYQAGEFDYLKRPASGLAGLDIRHALQNASPLHSMERTEDGVMAFVPRPSDGPAMQGDLPGAHQESPEELELK